MPARNGIAEGGNGREQIQELVQNAADALQGAPGSIEVSLTENALYVANEGYPFEDTGVRALLYTYLSNKTSKTGTEIGRFGLGFRSISGISDNLQIFSRSVSFEFSRSQSAGRSQPNSKVSIKCRKFPHCGSPGRSTRRRTCGWNGPAPG